MNQHNIISPKKLIEVALPLDAINAAAAREKSIRHGHPSTLHLWWARRPLAAARAVIFSQLVNDPEDLWRCQNPGLEPNKQVRGHWTKARARLFKIIEDIVIWENSNNDDLLEKARTEIRQSWAEVCLLNKAHPKASILFDPNKIPGLHDPFAGGGTIPLEAQRLGIETYASDLNPVSVMINKALIEIPPRFADRPPVNPDSRKKYILGVKQWRGAEGLADDVLYYGKWIRDEAEKRIGHLYPKIKITEAMQKHRPDLEPYVGKELTVIAWLWARTVKSPNPAFSHLEVPLVGTFVLSNKPGNKAFVDPIIDTGIDSSYSFAVRTGEPPELAKHGTTAGKRKAFRCLMSGTPIDYDYIREEGMSGRMGQRLMALVAEGHRGRVFISPDAQTEAIALSASASWTPNVKLPDNPRDFKTPNYGLSTFGDLFTQRQSVALVTFSDLVMEVRDKIQNDAVEASFIDDGIPLEMGGAGAQAYGDAISVYCGLAASKSADLSCSICYWQNNSEHLKIAPAFARQALPMNWDYAEGNPFSDSSGNFYRQWQLIAEVLGNLFSRASAFVGQANATEPSSDQQLRFYSTDPPYYDNIGYADLSDFFYVWLRRSLRSVFPGLLATIAVPKFEELVATPYRHGSKENAESFFLDGMTRVMRNLAVQTHPSAPVTIYYAFKQNETHEGGTNSTGWETFLEAVLKSGFSITGTWPMRTERAGGLRNNNQNSLASSIILVCRPRPLESEVISRRRFLREIDAALPLALDTITRDSEGLHSPVAPVDLSQAIIGPGMAVFSKYSAVLEADGTPMTVRTALQLINRFLAEDDFDSDTQFCLHWFEQYGWESGKFGEADTLARAKGTAVDGVKQSGVLHSAGGNVRLLKWAEYPSDWDPQTDQRLPIWEVLHQLIRVFNTDGESGAAAVFASVQSKAEAARQLAYRLYTLCERKNWAEDARAYNEVVTSWSGIEAAAAKEPGVTQRTLFDT